MQGRFVKLRKYRWLRGPRLMRPRVQTLALHTTWVNNDRWSFGLWGERQQWVTKLHPKTHLSNHYYSSHSNTYPLYWPLTYIYLWPLLHRTSKLQKMEGGKGCQEIMKSSNEESLHSFKFTKGSLVWGTEGEDRFMSNWWQDAPMTSYSCKCPVNLYSTDQKTHQIKS